MNHLEQLKYKMMVKPDVQERERVAVVIKGAKTDTEGAEEPRAKTHTVIVDKTKEGYDREALMRRLAENKKIKVSVRPSIAIAEQAENAAASVARDLPQVKRAKRVEFAQPVIIEEEQEAEQKETEEKEGEEKEGEEKEGEAQVEEAKADEESPEEFVMIRKTKEKEATTIPIEAPKERKRKTERVEKGVAVLGPEVVVEMGDTDITKRIPKKNPPVNIKVANYVMNNREIFVNFINSLFEPYKRELESNVENISCENIGKTSTDFSLLTHQKIVRDYLNLYTPYRGLLLYHGLGSGKTCTSIAIAEGMKDSKNVIIMTPASLRANYIGELKKCGDSLYKKNQFWEWISTDEHPEALQTMSAILNLPQEFIRQNRGAFFVNIKKKSNYDELSDSNKQTLENQLNEMIKQKYQFINYNGLREKRLSEMTSGYTKNLFDNSVVIIDEAHNFISRIVNKLKKEKRIPENQRGEK